jgi:hypothetical protein
VNLSFKQLLPPPPLPLVGSGAFCPLQGHTTDETGSGPSSDFDAHLPPSFPLSGENLSPFFFSLCLSFSFSEIWGCWPFVCVCVCVCGVCTVPGIGLSVLFHGSPYSWPSRTPSAPGPLSAVASWDSHSHLVTRVRMPLPACASAQWEGHRAWDPDSAGCGHLEGRF